MERMVVAHANEMRHSMKSSRTGQVCKGPRVIRARLKRLAVKCLKSEGKRSPIHIQEPCTQLAFNNSEKNKAGCSALGIGPTAIVTEGKKGLHCSK
jgi:hypothetical protein